MLLYLFDVSNIKHAQVVGFQVHDIECWFKKRIPPYLEEWFEWKRIALSQPFGLILDKYYIVFVNIPGGF